MRDATPDAVIHSPDSGAEAFELYLARNSGELPPGVHADHVSAFLHGALKPYEDPEPEVARGIADALGAERPGRGFVMLTLHAGEIIGALVMLKTGMSDYVPENLLLYVAVAPEHRSQGLATRMIRLAAAAVDGGIKLHVEYDNPAKGLYEHLGFENKYAEMRLKA